MNVPEIKKVKLEEYDIEINNYLTYAQIQQIVNSALHCENWAERQQTIDMLMMYHSTNISLEELEKVGHDALLQSGIIKAVQDNIENYYQILQGIDFYNSWIKVLTDFAKQMPSTMEKIQKLVVSRHAKSEK